MSDTPTYLIRTALPDDIEGLHHEGQVSWILGECDTGLVAYLNAQPTLP